MTGDLAPLRMTGRNRPRLLDLFCSAGGAAVGYARAGFDVTGVDITPQPRFPYAFIQADAMTFPLDGYDAIHASPPCQDYSRAMRHLATPGRYPRLIGPIRDRLAAAGIPWVIENVVGAPLPHQSDLFGRHGVLLCGTMFGLRLWRHRLFETSFPVYAPCGCDHSLRPMNPHHGATRKRWREHLGPGVSVERVWHQEMGVGFMSGIEADEAIPPVYTAWLGRLLLEHLAAPGCGLAPTGTGW